MGKLVGQSEERFQRLGVQDGAGQRTEFLLVPRLVHGADTPDLGIGDVLIAGDHPAIVEMQFEPPAQGGPLRRREASRLPPPGGSDLGEASAGTLPTGHLAKKLAPRDDRRVSVP